MGKDTYCLIDLEVSKMLVWPEVLATGFESTRTESTVIPQGQKYNAVIVITVSRQLEKVLVEQNHCQGLSTVMRNCEWSAIIVHFK
jgi:hypothetical protein